MDSQSSLKDTFIVIAAFNEAENLNLVLSELQGTLPGSSVLVADDGSRDGTADVVRGFGSPFLIMPFNVGVGGAKRAGFTYIFRKLEDKIQALAEESELTRQEQSRKKAK